MQTDQVQTTVLNVDDDAAGRYAISRMLKLGGHTVAEAGTGQEALHLARVQQPDLIVLDVNLPDMTGFEVVEQLRADPATAPIPLPMS